MIITESELKSILSKVIKEGYGLTTEVTIKLRNLIKTYIGLIYDVDKIEGQKINLVLNRYASKSNMEFESRNPDGEIDNKISMLKNESNSIIMKIPEINTIKIIGDNILVQVI